ncbi:MAG: sigma-70 family RNA polymerase sigma factor [Deltaproteobacteria bacterium]|nr:sigma-70 family RNA polymerase sigma factor [Deltaproteobacteria bacterium]
MQSRLTQLPDEALMKEYQLGSFEAFEILYERHSSKVFSYLRRRLTRSEIVDEVFQQIFSKIHSSRHTYHNKYTFLQWLFVVVKSTLIDERRKSSSQKETSADPQLLENIDAPCISNENDFSGASTFLKDLSPVQKEVISFKIINDLSYEEIAKRLQISQSNARQILSRAYKKMRTVLKRDEI